MPKSKTDRAKQKASLRVLQQAKADSVVLPTIGNPCWAKSEVSQDAMNAVEAIALAFDGVAAPNAQHRTLHQAQARDDYEVADRRQDHRGRWQDLPVSHLERCQWALPHLDEQGIHYYVPAVMVHYLRSPAHARTWLHESLIYTLEPSKEADLRAYQQGRFARFTFAQRQAILQFVVVANASPKAIEAWQQAVDAGDHPQWFDVYNPARS